MTSTRHIPLAAAGPTVRDVMLAEARTIPPDTPVEQVRETFANPRVKLLLVAAAFAACAYLLAHAGFGRA